VILAVILLFFGIYTLEPYYHTIKYIMQLNNMILVCYLLWRVETLSDLGITRSLPLTMEETDDGETMKNDFSPTATDKIGPLLQRHCIDTQLYLQHDLTLLQLAKAIGTNRYYLSQHFSRQGTTYNAYINGLRIQHFMNLYRKSVAFRQSFTAQQLAMESGFHNYRTFSNAFKHLMGLTVTGWIKNGSEDKTQQRLDAS